MASIHLAMHSDRSCEWRQVVGQAFVELVDEKNLAFEMRTVDGNILLHELSFHLVTTRAAFVSRTFPNFATLCQYPIYISF
jgi:hypothetical protein